MKWVYALALLAIVAGTAQVRAAASDYAFEAVNAEVKAGSGSELAVRLIHKPDGKAVEGALIIKSRLDMSPENVAAMTAKAEPAVESQPGVYRLKGDLDMAGRWALKLMAKVQGEPETIIGTVNFTAKE
jgi:YtkA-like